VTTLVVDASVGAKWFLPHTNEPYSQEALHLLDRYARGQLKFLVPDLYWTELTNIFWKAVRQGRWSENDGVLATKAVHGHGFPTFASKALIEDAFTIACNFQRSVYDGVYVALALFTKTELITADERLANALAAHFPVKWLGSFV